MFCEHFFRGLLFSEGRMSDFMMLARIQTQLITEQETVRCNWLRDGFGNEPRNQCPGCPEGPFALPVTQPS